MNKPSSMVTLLLFGLIGSALFSMSFVLYELMSVQGGHWFWSASLRCLFMWGLLSLIIIIQNKGKLDVPMALCRLFVKHGYFWCITGGIGLGTYGWLAFGADYAPAWVITSTYLFTVVASLIVLYFFGQRFSAKIVAYALIVFLGIVLANIGEGLGVGEGLGGGDISLKMDMADMLLFGALPALIAAFCFPIGNQLIWQASITNDKNPTATSMRERLLNLLPNVDSELLKNPLHKVWLLSAGSLPVWLVLGLLVRPPTVSVSQITVTFLVALLAGVLGTSIFLYARSRASSPNDVAMVDATQASEIIFALIGGMLLLSTPMPSMVSMVGIVMVIVGLVLFARSS